MLEKNGKRALDLDEKQHQHAVKKRPVKKHKSSEYVGAMAARQATNHRDEVIGYVLGKISLKYDDDEWIFRQQRVETFDSGSGAIDLASSMSTDAFKEHCYELLCRSEVEEAMVLYKEVKKRRSLLEKFRPLYLQKLRDTLSTSGISHSVKEAYELTNGWDLEIVNFSWKATPPEHSHCRFAMRIKSPSGALFRSIQDSCAYLCLQKN